MGRMQDPPKPRGTHERQALFARPDEPVHERIARAERCDFRRMARGEALCATDKQFRIAASAGSAPSWQTRTS